MRRLLLVLLLLVAACGGGDDDGSQAAAVADTSTSTSSTAVTSTTSSPARDTTPPTVANATASSTTAVPRATPPTTAPPTTAPPTTTTTRPAPSTLAMVISGFAFSPSHPTVRAGAVHVTVSNEDAAAHTFTVTGTSIDLPLAPHASAADDATLAAGSYEFHCKIHASMTGTLTVT
jgi:plastocyanin